MLEHELKPYKLSLFTMKVLNQRSEAWCLCFNLSVKTDPAGSYANIDCLRAFPASMQIVLCLRERRRLMNPANFQDNEEGISLDRMLRLAKTT